VQASQAQKSPQDDANGLIRLLRAPGKSLADIEALRVTGRVLTRGLGVFAECARLGASIAEAVAQVRGYIVRSGCKEVTELIVHGNAVNGPMLEQARFSQGDMLTLHLAARGTLGLWYELSGLFSFAPLSSEADRRLRAVELAYQDAAFTMASGHTSAEVHRAVDVAVAACGFTTAGRQRHDCSPIVTERARDDADVSDLQFESNTVVVFHPSPLPAGDREFRIAETMLVRPDGAVPMSPRGSIYRRIRV
jgi:Xaa-Pro aminopeptidase